MRGEHRVHLIYRRALAVQSMAILPPLLVYVARAHLWVIGFIKNKKLPQLPQLPQHTAKPHIVVLCFVVAVVLAATTRDIYRKEKEMDSEIFAWTACIVWAVIVGVFAGCAYKSRHDS